MASLAEQTGIDARMTPFVVLWTGGAAVLLTCVALTVPMLGPDMSGLVDPEFPGGLIVFTLLIAAWAMTFVSTLWSEALPFTMAAWAAGWHFMWRAGVPRRWCAASGGVLASVAAMVGPWAFRAVTEGANAPAFQALLLPFLMISAILSAMVVYSGAQDVAGTGGPK